MSITVSIILGVVLLFVGYIVYSFRKMKNMPNVPDSKKIKTLDNKNFKKIVRSGTVLVDFWAPWCGPCKMMAPTLNEIAESESDRITIAKVNVDHQKQLAGKYNIRSIPTSIIFKNGKEMKRITGVKSKNQLMKEINGIG